MLFFTIAIIIWWVVSVVVIEMNRAITHDKTKNEKDKKNETAVVGCLMFLFCLPYMLGELIYLLFALKVDPFLYPTYFMLGLYICEFVAAMVLVLYRRISGKEGKIKEKVSIYSYVTRFLTLAYFGYMLWAVIN